jgi:hypothetical protein
MHKVKVNGRKIIVVILVVIGSICVIDNTIRLGSEIGHAVTQHKWSTVVIH